MTTIRVNRADFRIEAEGHAGKAKPGEDIVCAGISALMQALLNVLFREEEDGYLTLDWYAEQNSAAIRIHAKPFNFRKETIRAYFRMTLMGMKAIEQNYGEYIKVIEEGQKDGDV